MMMPTMLTSRATRLKKRDTSGTPRPISPLFAELFLTTFGTFLIEVSPRIDEQTLPHALQKGVPRSTARYWLTSQSPAVVTLDVSEVSETELRREVIRLRNRNQRRAAVLRLVVVLLRVTGITLTRS